jgi:hypothetical protein
MTWMQGWFERILTRLDRIDGHLEKMAIKEKLLDGERLMDNQDVCQKLNISRERPTRLVAKQITAEPMQASLDIANTVLARHGIEPLIWDEVRRIGARMPTMTEAELHESYRCLWQKITEREAAKYKPTEHQTMPQMIRV